MSEKYRVHDWDKFQYSSIGEYIGENCTDRPLRNDILVDLLNKQYEEIQFLKTTITQLIEQNTKNNDLLLSDIRILQKALWCTGCENNYDRLRELKK